MNYNLSMRKVVFPQTMKPEEYADRLSGYYPLYLPTPFWEAQQRLFEIYDLLAKEFEVEILSGYREAFHQALLIAQKQTKARLSAHMLGVALDLRVPGEGGWPLYRWLERKRLLGELRVGITAYQGRFIHIDTAHIVKALLQADWLPKEWHPGARW